MANQEKERMTNKINGNIIKRETFLVPQKI